jgi:hypothetical protein
MIEVECIVSCISKECSNLDKIKKLQNITYLSNEIVSNKNIIPTNKPKKIIKINNYKNNKTNRINESHNKKYNYNKCNKNPKSLNNYNNTNIIINNFKFKQKIKSRIKEKIKDYNKIIKLVNIKTKRIRKLQHNNIIL